MKYIPTILMFLFSSGLLAQHNISIEFDDLIMRKPQVHLIYEYDVNENWQIGASIRYITNIGREYDEDILDGRILNYNLKGWSNGGVGLRASYFYNPNLFIQYNNDYLFNHQIFKSRFPSGKIETDATIVYTNYEVRKIERIRQTIVNTLGIGYQWRFNSYFIKGIIAASVSSHRDKDWLGPSLDDIVEGVNLVDGAFRQSLSHYTGRLDNDTRVYPSFSILVGYRFN